MPTLSSFYCSNLTFARVYVLCFADLTSRGNYFSLPGNTKIRMAYLWFVEEQGLLRRKAIAAFRDTTLTLVEGKLSQTPLKRLEGFGVSHCSHLLPMKKKLSCHLWRKPAKQVLLPECHKNERSVVEKKTFTSPFSKRVTFKDRASNYDHAMSRF